MSKEPETKRPTKGWSDGHDMLTGDVRQTLLRLTVPMILGMMAMVAFNLVDTIYVGRLGSKELAAMAFTFPVVFFYAGISAGIGVGASSVVALSWFRQWSQPYRVCRACITGRPA